jgi:argininosuccinate synthase
MPKYASTIYNGFLGGAPERLMLQQMIDASQANVSGCAVRLKLFKAQRVIATGS